MLNATANFILSQMSGGLSYREALARAQQAGLAERDAAADVEGHDAVAKLMILSGLVFGRQLEREQVRSEGITAITGQEIEQARAAGGRLKHVATLDFAGPDGTGSVSASVRPEVLRGGDPLLTVEGAANALVVEARPVGRVTIVGPGAGPRLAGQGVLSDIIAIAGRGPWRTQTAAPARAPG